MRIAKIFNNSVVLGVDDRGAEFVLLGKGIGFQASPGDVIDASLIEKRFVPGGTTSVERLAEYLDEIPPSDIELAEEIIAEARIEFGSQVSVHALFPLADHVSFALRRVRENMTFDYPLRWEIASLYPRETAFAEKVLDLVELRRGVRLPHSESGPLALHFVNAQFGAGDMSTTVSVTEALTATLEILGAEFGIRSDDESLDVARFLTHVRFLIVRRMRGVAPAAVDSTLAAAMISADPLAWTTASRLGSALAKRFGWEIGDDEKLYLAMHLSRLASSRSVQG